MSSSGPGTARASSSPSARSRTTRPAPESTARWRGATTGARTRWTGPRFGTARAWRRRRPTRTWPTHAFPTSSRPHIGTAGFPPMVPESRLESTEQGLVPKGDGWFVLNARQARWLHTPGRSAICEWEGPFEGEQDFRQLGINLNVLEPGVSMGMYHWEANQEDFLVLAGEAVLIVEGEERPLRQWDFVHCPAETKHIIVGAGDAPCLVLAVGARDHQRDGFSGSYTVDEAALRHGAGVERETPEPDEAYAQVQKREPT